MVISSDMVENKPQRHLLVAQSSKMQLEGEAKYCTFLLSNIFKGFSGKIFYILLG